MMGLFSNLLSIYFSLWVTELKATFAEVVKLANTLRSGRSERKLLRVQLPSSAILNHKLVKMIWVSAKGGPAYGGQLPPSAMLVFSQLSFSTLPLQRGSCRLQVPFRASEHSTVPRSEPFPSGATHAEGTLINLPDNILDLRTSI